MNRRFHHPRAFTLVELLVVIAIVALLVSLLTIVRVDHGFPYIKHRHNKGANLLMGDMSVDYRTAQDLATIWAGGVVRNKFELFAISTAKANPYAR